MYLSMASISRINNETVYFPLSHVMQFEAIYYASRILGHNSWIKVRLLILSVLSSEAHSLIGSEFIGHRVSTCANGDTNNDA